MEAKTRTVEQHHEAEMNNVEHATPRETLAKPQTHCQADRLPKDCIVLAHWHAES